MLATNDLHITLIKETELRFNIKIYLEGISDLIMLKFKNKREARNAFSSIKDAKKDKEVVQVIDDFEDVIIDGSKIVFLSFQKVGSEKKKSI